MRIGCGMVWHTCTSSVRPNTYRDEYAVASDRPVWYSCRMLRTSLLPPVLLLASCAASVAKVFAPLPPLAFIDTEVSTNCPITTIGTDTAHFEFSLSFAATPSNNVEVAIGCDANCDGHLSLDESGMMVGYDCGEWFVRSAEKDAVTSEAVSDAGTFRRVYEIRSRHVDPSWNLVKVTRRGFGAANENVTIIPVETGFGLTIK